jgi:hypothetical protein
MQAGILLPTTASTVIPNTSLRNKYCYTTMCEDDCGGGGVFHPTRHLPPLPPLNQDKMQIPLLLLLPPTACPTCSQLHLPPLLLLLLGRVHRAGLHLAAAVLQLLILEAQRLHLHLHAVRSLQDVTQDN